jgi:signal transduction histidine kinase
MFNAFQTTKTGGLGMWLSISRSIVENHYGQLWATANDWALSHLPIHPFQGCAPFRRYTALVSVSDTKV